MEAQIEWATSRGILGEWNILDGEKTFLIWRNVGLTVRRNFLRLQINIGKPRQQWDTFMRDNI